MAPCYSMFEAGTELSDRSDLSNRSPKWGCFCRCIDRITSVLENGDLMSNEGLWWFNGVSWDLPSGKLT